MFFVCFCFLCVCFFLTFLEAASAAATLAQSATAAAPLLAKLSGERLRAEILRLLEAPRPVTVVRAMDRHAVLAPVLPAPLDVSYWSAQPEPASRADAPPVLLIHGFDSSVLEFRFVLPTLVAAGLESSTKAARAFERPPPGTSRARSRDALRARRANAALSSTSVDAKSACFFFTSRSSARFARLFARASSLHATDRR